MATQLYTLTGPVQFVFPFNVRTKSELVLETVPGAVVPPQSYEVFGAGPQSTGVVVRWLDAPNNPLQQLRITRRVPVVRVTQYVNDEAVTSDALNDEIDNIYRLLGEAQDELQDLGTTVNNNTTVVNNLSIDVANIQNTLVLLQQQINECCGNGGGGNGGGNGGGDFGLIFPEVQAEGDLYFIRLSGPIQGVSEVADQESLGLTLYVPPLVEGQGFTSPLSYNTDNLFPGPSSTEIAEISLQDFIDLFLAGINAALEGASEGDFTTITSGSDPTFTRVLTINQIPTQFFETTGANIVGLPNGVYDETSGFFTDFEQAMAAGLDGYSEVTGLDVPSVQAALGEQIATIAGLESTDYLCTGAMLHEFYLFEVDLSTEAEPYISNQYADAAVSLVGPAFTLFRITPA